MKINKKAIILSILIFLTILITPIFSNATNLEVTKQDTKLARGIIDNYVRTRR